MQQGRGGGKEGGQPPASEQVVEEASPISSRPPAANLEELMRFSTEEAVVGGSSGGVSSGNRWPREETLALLRIRSELDATFRDATVKGPLWEDVSRKLGELGYKRSGKKCKEKFENVHKYYKRTKEGKSGRQDGKTYKFFTQLEALNTTPNATTQPPLATPGIASGSAVTTLDVAPLSVGIGIGIAPPDPIHFSPHRIIPPPASQPISVLGMSTPSPYRQFPATTSAVPASASFGFAPTASAAVTAPLPIPVASSFGITFSSHSSSTASGSGFDDDEREDMPEPSTIVRSSRKRKRRPSKHGDGGGSRLMMGLFENLMRQVIEKQDSMQRSFIEAIERRERERLNREEAWRRQESARLAREHELLAHERVASASRDAAIISLIQKITGHTIHLPPPLPQPPQPQHAPTTTPHPPPPPPPIHQPISSPLQISPNQPKTAIAIQEQQNPPPQNQEIGSEPSSSRWPKPEVIALINLRSGMETKYQEAGPKAPLWEEISAGMKRLGYNRNPKRCKEKWENINKYYKKVKESSNKKRPEDAKTCPYFHQLDTLYRSKVIGGSSSSSFIGSTQQEQHSVQIGSNPVLMESVKADAGPPAVDRREETRVADQTFGSPNGQRGLFGEGSHGAAKKPEDLVRVLMDDQQERPMPRHEDLHGQRPLMVVDYDKIDEPHSYNLDLEEDDNEEDEEIEQEEEEEEEEEVDEEGRKDYNMEFQQRNATKEGNSGPPSLLTMVQ